MVRSLSQAVEVAGLGSSVGQGAAYQFIWAHSYAGDVQAALRGAENLASQPDASLPVRTSARWALALFAEKAGDPVRARRELTALVAEFENDKTEDYRNIARLAADRLKLLR